MLPVSIQRELDAAYQRTGETDALRKAKERLPLLFRLPPLSIEGLFEQQNDDPTFMQFLVDTGQIKL